MFHSLFDQRRPMKIHHLDCPTRIEIAVYYRVSTSITTFPCWFSTNLGISDGSLDIILLNKLCTSELGLNSVPWWSQTILFATSSKRRKNGATEGKTRVYTASALEHALIALWDPLGVNESGFMARHCNRVIPAKKQWYTVIRSGRVKGFKLNNFALCNILVKDMCREVWHTSHASAANVTHNPIESKFVGRFTRMGLINRRTACR